MRSMGAYGSGCVFLIGFCEVGFYLMENGSALDLGWDCGLGEGLGGAGM